MLRRFSKLIADRHIPIASFKKKGYKTDEEMSTSKVTICRNGSDRALLSVYKSLNDIKRVCTKDPGMNNLVGWELEWNRYPLLFDIMAPRSELHHLKMLERDIYLHYMEDSLRKLPARARVLDAGSGVGRFGIELGRRGHEVSLVDLSATSLKTALRHIVGRGIQGASLYLSSIEDMGTIFRNDTFDATVAIEAVCYVTDPLKALKELIRVTKKGGPVFVSVEGLYGAVLADEQIPEEKVATVLKTGVLQVEHSVFTRYYTERGFRDLLESSGAEVITVQGTHYVPEGPFDGLMDIHALKSADYRKRVMALDVRYNASRVFHPLARSWLGIVRK